MTKKPAKKTAKKTNRPTNLQRMLDRLAVLAYERLYGLYCAGVVCGLAGKMLYFPPDPTKPREAWAFAYGMRYGKNPLLDIEAFKHDLKIHFKQSR